MLCLLKSPYKYGTSAIVTLFYAKLAMAKITSYDTTKPGLEKDYLNSEGNTKSDMSTK